jgi:hypothetical protein
MKNLKFIILWMVLFYGWLPYAVRLSPSRSLSITGHLQDNCQSVYDQLTRDEDWLEQLIDPILTTPEQILEKLQYYTTLHTCLDGDKEALSGELKMAHLLSEYFLIFVGGYQTPQEASRITLVSLALSDDPALVQIRDQAGILPPDGYVFVRFYSSRQAMPELVRRAFEDGQVAGVTIFTRYIAILEEDRLSSSEKMLQTQTLPETVSHELVHAYVHSWLGFDNLDAFPTWYNEGIAIYFSGSGKDHSVITPAFELHITSPQDYRDYETNFRYLEEKLGREQLLARVKRSIEMADHAVIYQDLGFSDDQSLIAEAQRWNQTRVYTQWGIGLAAILLVSFGLMRLMPEERCEYCRYAGKRKDFADGYCPRCHAPFLS